ncbi:MAG: transglycosylase domain-containing protein [Bacteroidota bacterium]|nr:transglycosylase domain-containing protein [Bacteroidota bacterium]
MKNKKRFSTRFRKRFLWIFWGLFGVILAGLIFYFAMTIQGKTGMMPSFKQLENPQTNFATQIISSDQQLLGTYFRENRTRTEFDSISPQVINALIATEDIRFNKHSGIDFRALARVAAGVLTGNHKGGGSTISQQLSKLLFPREDLDNTFKLINRKLREWVIAVKLEKAYSKEEILVMYLNHFDFLNLAVGIESASRVYFSTTPDSLNTEQAAMLVGMVKNPSLYNPLRFPENTTTRRNVVLNQMEKYGFIEEDICDSIKKLPLGIKYSKVDHNTGNATYFRELLRQWLTASKPHPDEYIDQRLYVQDSISWNVDPSYGWCNKNVKSNGSNYNIYSDGLRIYTTIDLRMQEYAEQAISEHLGGYLQDKFDEEQKGRSKAPFSWQLTNQEIERIMQNSKRRCERYRVMKSAEVSEDSIDIAFNTPVSMQVFSWEGEKDTVISPMDSIRYYKQILRAGFMSMEPHTGFVKAYCGGINYKHFKYDMVSRARRQVGSTFKPFIYTLAMQNNYSPCLKVPNIEVSFKMPPGQQPEFYTPKYSTSKREGEMVSLKYGLAKSLNQISAWVLKQFSPEAVIDLAKSMGISSHINPYPSICVGAAEVTLKEMTGAFCTWANEGIYTRPVFITRIEDKNGNLLAEFQPMQKEVMDKQTAYLTLALMKGVVDFGTGIRLRYRYNFTSELAGKTGTTNNHSDGWFMGIAPRLVSGVWVGGEERSIHFRGIRLGQGASMALPIWALYMEKVYKNPNLPYTQEDKFKKPDHLGVETDCEKWEKEHQGEEMLHM